MHTARSINLSLRQKYCSLKYKLINTSSQILAAILLVALGESKSIFNLRSDV